MVVGADLADTVPVDRGGIIGQSIVDRDLDGITPVANNSRSRDLAVDGKSWSLFSFKVPLSARDGEVIFADIARVWGRCVAVTVDTKSITP